MYDIRKLLSPTRIYHIIMKQSSLYKLFPQVRKGFIVTAVQSAAASNVLQLKIHICFQKNVMNDVLQTSVPYGMFMLKP